jgi:hypothetical protein
MCLNRTDYTWSPLAADTKTNVANIMAFLEAL